MAIRKNHVVGKRLYLGIEKLCECGCGETFIVRKSNGNRRFVSNHWFFPMIQLVESIKASNACLDCGRMFPPECMDFDHRPGETKSRTMRLLANEALIFLEIEKCDLVCACCHRTRTKLRHYAQSSNF